VENEKRLREKLFQHLDGVLSVSQKKFAIENKPDKERRAWARILIQAINSYGKLLEFEELEMRIEDLEEKLKNSILIPKPEEKKKHGR
jgi:hypothetical protein